VRLLALGLALAPLFPFLGWLAPLFLPGLRGLPRPVLGLLGFYAFSLLVPALFAPESLALPLALFRVLYVLGLVGAGVVLARRLSPEALAPLGYGLAFLYLSAFFATYLVYGDRAVGERLAHPFHNPVGLGLMGAVGVFLALYLRYPWPFRLLLGLLGGAVLLLSGSRGGMLGFLLGGAGGLLFRRRGFWALGLSGLLLGVAGFLDTPVTERFFQTQLSGREGLWLRAYEVYAAHPWTGVGPYLLGDHLKGTLFGDCFLFSLVEARGLTCPAWLGPLGGFWQFAHNHLLQALGESGLWGALGLALLVGGFLAAAWGDGLLFSLLLAYAAMGMVDNPFSVPSPFRGEIFFLAGGMALARGWIPLNRLMALATGVILLWALPFWQLALSPAPPPPGLAYAALGQEGGVVRLQGGEGYRVQVWLCAKACRRVGWEWDGSKPIAFSLPGDLPPGRYRLRVLLFAPSRSVQKPLYVLEREVER
jgi:O-antigen ligase